MRFVKVHEAKTNLSRLIVPARRLMSAWLLSKKCKAGGGPARCAESFA